MNVILGFGMRMTIALIVMKLRTNAPSVMQTLSVLTVVLRWLMEMRLCLVLMNFMMDLSLVLFLLVLKHMKIMKEFAQNVTKKVNFSSLPSSKEFASLTVLKLKSILMISNHMKTTSKETFAPALKLTTQLMTSDALTVPTPTVILAQTTNATSAFPHTSITKLEIGFPTSSIPTALDVLKKLFPDVLINSQDLR